jgi:ABC-2 type transport system ATP-binding protein
MGLVRPTKGTIFLWGDHHTNVTLKAKIGFLPESPYFYNYLKAREFLSFTGQLFGLSKRECSKRVDALFDLVGLTRHKDKLIKNYSKGMLQRLGLAQTLVNDPELLVLDEPMSGLDPLGRKEVRDIIMLLKERGNTIVFSSHILSDVETICDRVGIIIGGKLKDCGPLADLLTPKIRAFEICVKGLRQEVISRLKNEGLQVINKGAETFIVAEEHVAYALLPALLENDGTLLSFTPRKESLEDIYLGEIRSNGV